MATSRRRRDRTTLLLLGLALLAFLLRALELPSRLPDDSVLFVGGDAYWHLRRVVYALASGAPPELDRYMHFPDGSAGIWTSWFDATEPMRHWTMDRRLGHSETGVSYSPAPWATATY